MTLERLAYSPPCENGGRGICEDMAGRLWSARATFPQGPGAGKLNVASIFLWIAFLIPALLLSACGGKTVVESDLRIKGAPDWVNEGTNILNDKGGRLFHGVGSAPPIGDDSLQISTADDRARAEVARILSSYMNVVSKDYLSSTKTGEGNQVDQSVSRDIENVTKLNMTGVRIIGRWRQKKTNVVYSLAEIDIKQIKNNVGQVEAMNQGFFEHFNRNADNIFDSIAVGEKK